MPEANEPRPAGVYINGEGPYEWEDLSFREQREVRKLTKSILDDPDDVGIMDVLPAFVTVIVKRDDPEFSIEQALDLKEGDLEPPEKPTPRARKPKAAE